jgi:hypothetical protein
MAEPNRSNPRSLGETLDAAARAILVWVNFSLNQHPNLASTVNHESFGPKNPPIIGKFAPAHSTDACYDRLDGIPLSRGRDELEALMADPRDYAVSL